MQFSGKCQQFNWTFSVRWKFQRLLVTHWLGKRWTASKFTLIRFSTNGMNYVFTELDWVWRSADSLQLSLLQTVQISLVVLSSDDTLQGKTHSQWSSKSKQFRKLPGYRTRPPPNIVTDTINLSSQNVRPRDLKSVANFTHALSISKKRFDSVKVATKTSVDRSPLRAIEHLIKLIAFDRHVFERHEHNFNWNLIHFEVLEKPQTKKM